MSNEQKTWLFKVYRDYTTQLCWDSIKPLQGSLLKQPVFHEMAHCGLIAAAVWCAMLSSSRLLGESLQCWRVWKRSVPKMPERFRCRNYLVDVPLGLLGSKVIGSMGENKPQGIPHL